MLDINNDIIFNTIDNGIIILDEDLNILAWNNWLEIRTSIQKKDILNKNICEEFPYINKQKLKRKMKSVLVTKNPSFYSVDPHKYLIKIKSNSIVEKVYNNMRQDITLVTYDLEKKYVCLYIYDNTKFYETSAKLEKSNEDLEELSNRDPLTHLYNRRYFTEISSKMLNLANRSKHTIATLVLDIDNFKAINDKYGHAIGDKVIVATSRVLENSVRKSDVVSRFGGEEFIILLYNINADNLEIIAEKVRKNIEELSIQTTKGKINFTISLGATQYDCDYDINKIEYTINRADKALYRAKETGKNKVVIY